MNIWTLKVAEELIATGRHLDVKKMLGGTNFKKSIVGRTFVQSTGNVSFDQDGFTIPNYLLKQFNPITYSYEVPLCKVIQSGTAKIKTTPAEFGRVFIAYVWSHI